jgi:ATP-dependent DNA ligase
MITPPTFPARPINGGPFDKAPDKFGEWGYELKWNGWRLMVHGPSGTAFNRHLEPSTISDKFPKALAGLKRASKVTGIEWWDVEALERRHEFAKGTLIVLDAVVRDMVYTDRKAILRKTFDSIPWPCKKDSLYSSDHFTNGASLWEDARAFNEGTPEFIEGIVAKRLNSEYPFQLRKAEQTFPFWVKHRIHF